MHLLKIKFPKAFRTFSKNFYVFFYFCKTIAPVIRFVNTPCRIFFGILQKYLRKNPALQDSPPAAGRFSDIIPLRRSAILPGGLFYITGNFNEISRYIKKSSRSAAHTPQNRMYGTDLLFSFSKDIPQESRGLSRFG